MINYTIIIPHKNIPDLLQRCLDSIPCRDDIQVIVVDDNSDSQIVDFDNFTGSERDDIEIYFPKEGKGAGYARNVGLEHAKGKWILFADADDMFNEGFLSVLDNYLETDYDLIYLGVNGFHLEDNTPSYRNSFYDEIRNEAIRKKDLYYYYYQAFAPWGKMLRTSFIKENHLLFEETNVYNDRMFSVRTVFFAKKITYDIEKVYTSFNRPDSLVKKQDIESDKTRFIVDCEINVFLKEKNKFKYRVNLFMSSLVGIKHHKLKMLGFYRKKMMSDYRGCYTLSDLFYVLFNYAPKRIIRFLK